MPLSLLLSLVIGGIAAIALLLHLTGRSQRRLLSVEDARREWNRHFPDDDIVDVTLAPDSHAALILTRQGPGLLWAMGADTAARRLRDFDLIETPKGLTVRFHDFTAPHVTLRMEPELRARWIIRMDPI